VFFKNYKMNMVKNYYELFSDRYLLKDLKKRNIRQAKISKLIYEFVEKNAVVLDIGCGIGINARELLKKNH